MTVSERGLAVARATTRFRRRTIAANILVAVAALVLLLMAAVDWYLLIQLNPVTRFFIFGTLLVVGWLPVALVITAVCLRPYWLTFISLGVVGAWMIATLVVVWAVPDAPYPYPEISWPHRGSS
ncbi:MULTISPECIES: hypothetical protein [unclassified Leifsonia]|uniref:hypothetical protein n=1 Tax=unclassified Leifsonia TaxID=2663824 RepID=UPI00037C7E40|nr:MULTISPECIES: hypothetical protein [unclassified Leifsonia]TDP99832.1 hypothetical protein AXZ95_3762 [Leifsonia sp. 115AMFTsu3.1]